MKLVSINIPTYNSEKTIEQCINCVLDQSYKNIEIIVMDNYSTDRTLEIVESFRQKGVKLIKCEGRLLRARIEGVYESKGKYIVFLDSDQFLERTAVERAINEIENGDTSRGTSGGTLGYDYLWLYERAYNKGFLPSLHDADRVLTQKYLKEGTVSPRFFKRNILLKAFKTIPKEHINIIVAQEQVVIMQEVEKVSKNMGMIPNAVFHVENKDIIKFFKKQYRWGITTRDFYDRDIFRNLITEKNKFRGFYFGNPILSIEVFILRVMRGIPYALGFYIGGEK